MFLLGDEPPFVSLPPVQKIDINYPHFRNPGVPLEAGPCKHPWRRPLRHWEPVAATPWEERQHQKRGLSSASCSQYESWIPSPMHSPSPGFSCTPGSSPSCLPFPLFPPESEDFVALTFNYIKFRCLYPLWMSNCSAISTKRHRKYENRRQDLEQDYF